MKRALTNTLAPTTTDTTSMKPSSPFRKSNFLLVMWCACMAGAKAFCPSSGARVTPFTNRASGLRLQSAVPDDMDNLWSSFQNSSDDDNYKNSDESSSTATLALRKSVAQFATPAAVVLMTLSALSGTTAPTPAPTPFVVSEILTDLSHVSLDLVTLWGPSAVVVRLFAIVGRILCVLADYVPDQFMNPEEVVFQSFMLAAATAGLVQGLMPQMIGLTAPPPTIRDGKAYKAWGHPAGMTWDQYKALTVNALQFRELRPGESLAVETLAQENDTTLYWLYKGDVSVVRHGSKAVHLSRKRSSSSNINQNERLRQVDGAQYVNLVTLQTCSDDRSCIGDTVPTTITAGAEGATLLACNMKRLDPLLRHDASLKDVLKTILWQGLQDQLADAYRHEELLDVGGP